MTNPQPQATPRSRRYWGSRPDRWNIDLFAEELSKGRLRQGWGESDDLSLEVIWNIVGNDGKGGQELTEGQRAAYRNYPFNLKWGEDTMHQGDLVLVPNVPKLGSFHLVELTDNDYHFEPIALPENRRPHGLNRDYGHWRAIRLVSPREGIPSNQRHVGAPIRQSLHCRSRIWRIDHLSQYIDELVSRINQGKLGALVAVTPEDRYLEIIGAAEQQARKAAREKISTMLKKQFQSSEFEVPVLKVLKTLFPGSDSSIVSGQLEAKHGTDILVRIKNPFADDDPFLVAVQVKMHEGETDDGVEQLGKAAQYWRKGGLGGAEGQLIALVLLSAADRLTSGAESKLQELRKSSGLACYPVTGNELRDLFATAALQTPLDGTRDYDALD